MIEMLGKIMAVLPLALAAGCVDDTMDTSSAAPDLVSRAEMPAFCRGAASERFGESPMEITTLPAEPDQGMFTVYGQYPSENPTNFFTCTFSAEGRLVGVDRS